MFAIFMLITIFGQLIQQLMPLFISQRTLYEARERPSKTYSWPAFLLASMLAEVPYNTAASLLLYPPVYYLLGLQHNAAATGSATERAGLMWLLVWASLLFASTLAAALVAPSPTAEAGSNLSQLCVSLGLVFCGVLPPAPLLPAGWRWMNRLSPFTYLVSAMLSTAVGGASVRCADNEVLRFSAPQNVSCEAFVEPWVEVAGGYLVDGEGGECAYCKMASADAFLKGVGAEYQYAWRNFGLLWVYVGVNVVGALGLYWLCRVPKRWGKGKKGWAG